MALSNIFREPRREITESAVGLGLFSAFTFGDYQFALWFEGVTGGHQDGCPWSVGLLVGIALVLGSAIIIAVTHSLGEVTCNALQDRGIHLRPRKRANRS